VLHELAVHRRFVFANALTEMRHRYAGTAMGVVWHVIHPLSLLLLFSFVFSGLLPARLPNSASPTVFLISGLLPWLAFADCLSRCTTALTDNAHYIRKIALPEVLFAARTAVTSAILMMISICLVIIGSLFSGVPLSWSLLTIPLAALLLSGFAFGLGLMLAPIHVFLKDTAQTVGMLVQFWMWLSPVILAEEILPQALRAAQTFNPVYWYLRGIRDPLLTGQVAPIQAWAVMLLACFGTIWIGYRVLRRLRGDIRDAI